MTDTQEQPPPTQRLAQKFGKAALLSFIGISLIGCCLLFRWVINNRLEQVDIPESSPITAEYREKQLACLARNIYHEAGYEPFEGKVAVAQVTMNRAASSQFPNDVCRVVYQKNVIYSRVLCQFSWVCMGNTGPKPVNQEAFRESMEVAKRVLLENYRLPGLATALYYHADYVSPGWHRKQLIKIGRHIFYQ